MDMSFTFKPQRRASHWVVSLADIKTVADERRIACKTTMDFLRGQDEGCDPVRALACVITLEPGGMVDAVTLGGSFNPLVAQQLMVGKTE